jgi:DivIVA domain-containing protein
VLIVIVVAVLGAVILAAIGWLLATVDNGLHPDPPAQPDLGPVDRPLTSGDVPALRFRLAFRGYRMADVDDALDRLAEALADAEDRATGKRRGQAPKASPPGR